MKPDRKEQGPESIQVAFGDEFSYSKEKGKKYVVIELGEGNIVHSSAVTERDGLEALGMAGTTDYEDIDEITGNWSLDRIIKAVRNFYGSPARNVEEAIKEQSKMPPKTLTKS